MADRVSGGRQLEVVGGAGCYGARLGGDATQCVVEGAGAGVFAGGVSSGAGAGAEVMWDVSCRGSLGGRCWSSRDPVESCGASTVLGVVTGAAGGGE